MPGMEAAHSASTWLRREPQASEKIVGMIQATTVMAAVVYHTANRDELMPRKPLPRPLLDKQPVPEILEC